MIDYTHQAGAQWPEELITLTHYQDADNTVGTLIAQIKAYQEAGDFDSAQTLINDNIETLRPYVFDSSAINKYVEELRNLQIYTKSHKQQIFYSPDEPSAYVTTGDIWVGDD